MASDLLPLDGRVALVSGGSRGIGKAVSSALAASGAVVAINYRERDAEAFATVDEIVSAGGRCISVRGDVSDSDDVRQIVDRVNRTFGHIDILVNNAGIGRMVDVTELTEGEFDRTIAVNLRSAFLLSQAVLASMREQRWGRIVNISSAAARGPGIVGVHYNASKAGLEGLTRAYASRVAGEGVTVNAVAPALIDTEMIAAVRHTNLGARLPVGRIGTAHEVAQVVLMLVNNGFITGQTVAVNGGASFL
jgi:3-oxoacyl-[acyl-carrier protein] reductase